MEVSKSDWKLYREKMPVWQENYMDCLNKEYIAILSAREGKASDRFWELEKRVRNDRKHPGVVIQMRKSEMVFDLIRLLRLDVITLDDLEDFSTDLKDMIKEILNRAV